MKTKNVKKIVVSTMALAMGAALAGSISGTVAWYQYSTRASVSYVGVSKHCTHALEVSLDGTNWGTNFNSAALTAAAKDSHDGSNWSPVTQGVANAGNAALGADWYGNPKCGNFDYSLWSAADAGAFLQFELYARVLDVNGAETKAYLAEDLYLSDLVVEPHTTNSKQVTGTDFAESVRIHVATNESSPSYALLAKTAGTTVLNGQLDVDNDGDLDTLADADKHYADWGEDATAVQYYGGSSAINQVTKAWSTYIADDSGAELVVGSATKLGTTTTNASAPLKLSITIWMEGWAQLANGAAGNADNSSPFTIWDVAKYIGEFHIGMQFSVGNHEFHD